MGPVRQSLIQCLFFIFFCIKEQGQRDSFALRFSVWPYSCCRSSLELWSRSEHTQRQRRDSPRSGSPLWKVCLHSGPCLTTFSVGGTKDTFPKFSLITPCMFSRLETVEILLKKHPELIEVYRSCNKDSVSSFRTTPLHAASRNGHR